MQTRRSLLIYLGEAIDRYRVEQVNNRGPDQRHVSSGWLNWISRQFIPNLGSVLLVLILFSVFPGLAAPLTGINATSISTIPYQGRLADASGNPVTGKQNMEFRIYDVPAGGTPLWEEFWTGANSVDVSDGLFSVMLGSINTGLTAVVQGNTTLYLGITVGTDSEMSPRVQMGSVPFSIWSLTVADNSVTTTKLADNAVTGVKVTDGTLSSADLANNAITTIKIADGAITQEKISDNTLLRTFGSLGAKVQYGRVPYWSASCTSIKITFQQPFSQTPIVLVSQDEATAGYGYYLTYGVTAAGFSIKKMDNCETGGYVNWIAIGN